jgi:hypothetical protein
MKELHKFLHFYQIKLKAIYPVTTDMYLKLLEKFKEYDEPFYHKKLEINLKK